MGPRMTGAHPNDVIDTGATRVSTAGCVLPFNEAVTVADCWAGLLVAVAVNVAELLPAATVTLTGTVKAALSLDSATTVSNVTARLRNRVQVEEPGVVIVCGLQVRLDS